MATPMEGVERSSMAAQETERSANSEPGTPRASTAVSAQEEKEAEEHDRAKEEYLAGVQRRIESYESCATALSAAAASLQELSTNLDTMKEVAQQLNAFTGGWLAVWKRPSA